ncbi:hypothetical protein [Oryzomicrobium sp.]|uniref:hypothetical protein n=1 Tax=Oryzomicrobium sp. TaxID=1911578 RepID=UPI0025FA7E29|nr:hypothetical protein [Oryzomicrobium sp.]MCE1241824.1 hypothetical protein [Oryzomicrobium sp.]
MPNPMESPRTLALSFLLAAAVMGGAVLLVVHGEQGQVPGPGPSPVPQPASAAATPTARPAAPAPQAAAPTVPQLYKCRGPQGNAYRDQGCRAGEQLVAVERHTGAADPAAAQAEVERLRQRVAAMAAEREARHAYPEPTAMRTAAVDGKAAQCEALAQDITRVDAILRQPHSATEGDHWTTRRKELSDARFSLGC